jgi:hypothetical protein
MLSLESRLMTTPKLTKISEWEPWFPELTLKTPWQAVKL